MKPKLPITDKRFIYVPSHQTDIRATLEKAKREQAEKKPNVTPIKRAK